MDLTHQQKSPAAGVVRSTRLPALQAELLAKAGYPAYLVWVTAIAVVYFGAAKLGLSMAFLHALVSPVWPPTGIAIAAVLWLGYRISPAIFLGAFLANLATGEPLATAGGIAIGNTLEAVTATFLLRRFVGLHSPFYRARDVLKFVLIGVLISPTVSATIGNASLCLGGGAAWSNFGTLWLTWWIGDGVGALVVAPLVLTWVETRVDRGTQIRLVEFLLLLILLSAASAIVFREALPPTNFVNLTLARLIIPFLLWAAFRLGPRGVATAIALFSGIAIWGTRLGLGPIVGQSPNDSLLLLQVAVAANGITFLVLAGVVAERKAAEQAISFVASIVESTDDAVIGRTLDGIILSWNKGAERIYGYSADEAIGCPLSILIPSHRANEMPRMLEQLKRGEQIGRFETERVRKDGRIILVSLTVSPIKDADGKTVGASLIARDITERKQNEKALRQGEEQLSLALEAANMGAWSYDVQTGAVNWSPSLEAMHGIPPGTFGGTFDDYLKDIHPADRQRVTASVERAIEQKADHEIEYRIIRPDGTVRWVLGRGQVTVDEVGNPIRMSGVCMDISERKKAQEALSESEAQLANMIASAMDAIITVDSDQRILVFNAAAEKMFRCSAQEVLGQSIDRFIPEQFRAEHRKHIRSFGDTNVTKRSMGALGSLSGFRADGHEFPIEASISQIEVKAQKLYTVILRDITERQRAAEERERLLAAEQEARAEAEAANRAKDEFLALVSHELRTPLNSIVGWVDILLTNPDRDEAHLARALEVIKRNAALQARIIEDILDVSRIVVAGKLQLEIRPVELPTIIHAAIGAVQLTAAEKRIRIRQSLDRSVDPVLGDPYRLQQIVWNLLANAIKFTPDGGEVEVSLEQAGSNARITVRDTGEGIRPEFLPHIFDRFSQADSSGTRSYGGLGLGLAIVRHLVELHGGTVEAYSAGEKQGAVFTVTLPSEPAHVESCVSSGGFEADRDSRDDGASLAGIRVLIVDDDLDSREVLAALLELRAAEVRSAGSAREALDAMTDWKPDVLVSDIGMPGQDGYDLIREVRSRAAEDGGQIPAIALTGYAAVQDGERALSAGYHTHMAKPVEPGHLVKLIASFGGKSGHSSP